MSVRTILSGGQTGVDQAALRAARALGLRIEGWCPPGRACEAGAIADEWPLVETPRERSPLAPHVPRSLRTEWNVRDSDATLVLRRAGARDPGTDFTLDAAEHHRRPSIEIDPWLPDAGRRLGRWLRETTPQRLNVAGPSQATDPGVGERTFDLLLRELELGDRD